MFGPDRVLSRVGAFVALLVAAFAVLAGTADPAAAANSAVVVIDTGSGHRSVTITFTSSSISGLEALQIAGANPVTRPYGPGLAVCQLDGFGHAPQSCLGTSSDPRYWVYFRASAGSSAWSYSGAGAGATTVKHGDWEGWRFGTGQKPAVNPPAPKPPPPPTPPSPPPTDTGTTSGGTSGGGVSGSPGSSPGGDTAVGTGADANGLDDVDDTDSGSTPTADVDDHAGADSDADTDVQLAAGLTDGSNAAAGAGSPVGLLAVLALSAALIAAAVVVWRRRVL